MSEAIQPKEKEEVMVFTAKQILDRNNDFKLEREIIGNVFNM